MKELIERLRTHTENCSECESTPKMGDWSGVCDRCADMSQAADALERYQWRRVSEGLPEPLKVVLCLNESCGVIDRYVDDDHEWFNVPYWWKEKGGVTHWMPLPEPPQD